MPNIVYIILVIVLIVILLIFSYYNKLIKLQNKVKKSASNIEICLNQRFDLIPNIVECVKGYTSHESSTLEKIVSLRNMYKNNNLNMNAASNLNNDLNKYLAVIENYPELKANMQFLDLQHKLSDIEKELVYARNIYNESVTRYNTIVESVPSNIVASIFNFKQSELFQIDEDKKENIKIDL